LAPPLRWRELSLKAIKAACLAGFLSVAFALAMPIPAAADTSSDAAYRQAVSQTLALVRGAQPNDTAVAHQALNVLEAGTGLTQPEVVADLEMIPPDFEDAITRLQGRAVERPGAAVADLGDDTDVLVALDDRKRRRALVLGAHVLLGLAAIGVLVGAADAAHLHGDDHRVVAVGQREGRLVVGGEPARKTS